MDLRDYLDILRARWRLITVTTLLGVMAAAVASMLATPMYTATATTFVSIDGGQGADVNQQYTGALFAQQRVKSYPDLVTSDGVMSAVIAKIPGLEGMEPTQLAAKIDVNNPLDTVNLEISATDANPALAQEIANATAAQLTEAAAAVEQPGPNGEPLVKVTTTQPATQPTSPSSPRTLINLALGFLVGLAVGVGAAVLLETLDTRIKSIDALAKYFDHPLLGVIGYESEATKKPLLTEIAGQSKRAESFRQVRTNLQFVDIDHRPRSIVVTSAVPREGKSTTAINLAITIAQTGQPVFLIEGDLRRPKVAEYLGIEGGAGLTDVLVGRATVDEVMQPWGQTGNLWVLASGALPPNPSELLGSQAMADLIGHLEKRATLIIDSPPLLPVTDGAVLARLAGGALMVIATGKTRREQVRTAISNIESVGGKILGLVLNMAPARGPDSHRYGYGYQYEYASTDKRGKFDDHAPVIPAGLGGLPGVNGSPTPTMPVGPVAPEPAPKPEPTPAAKAPEVKAPDVKIAVKDVKPLAKSSKGSKDARHASVADVIEGHMGHRTHEPETAAPAAAAAAAAPKAGADGDAGVPTLTNVVPVDQKVIGGAVGVPLAPTLPVALPTVIESTPTLLPADTASGARFGLDDDAPLAEVGEVPVGWSPPPPPLEPPRPPELTGWTPPRPRAALDPLTAPYEEVQVADLQRAADERGEV